MLKNVRPNLFIVGAPKCGTTAWVEYLSSHKDIFFAYPKEPHYFCDDFPNFRWARTDEEYANFFNNMNNEKIIAEASVRYLYSKNAAKNISAANPYAKILIFIREHSKFIHSYHNQVILNGEDDVKDTRKAWELSLKGRNTFPKNCPDKSFLDYQKVGRFSEQIQRYLDVFPAEQIRVIRFEDWIKNPQETYDKILRFLTLPRDNDVHFRKTHSAKKNRFSSLDRFIKHPPQFVVKTTGFSKRILRRDSLNIATKVRSLNKQSGYIQELPNELAREIQQYFVAEIDILNELLDTYDLNI